MPLSKCWDRMCGDAFSSQCFLRGRAIGTTDAGRNNRTLKKQRHAQKLRCAHPIRRLCGNNIAGELAPSKSNGSPLRLRPAERLDILGSDLLVAAELAPFVAVPQVH